MSADTDEAYMRFLMRLDETSPAIRRMRQVLAPLYGTQRTEALVGVYAGCVFSLQNCFGATETAERDSDQARNNLMGFSTTAYGHNDNDTPPPPFATDDLITDLLVPYLRHAASELTASVGAGIIATVVPHREISDTARASMLRVLGGTAGRHAGAAL